MKKNAKSIMLLLWLTIAKCVAQSSDSTFYYLDKSTLTNNVLVNFNENIYWCQYDGLHDKTMDNMFGMQLLSDLNYYQFGNATLPNVETIKVNAANEIRNNNRTPIFIINYDYTKLKDSAEIDSLVYRLDGKYYDVVGRNNSPYTNRTLLAGAPLREKIYAGANNFLISRDYFVTNKPDPTQIEIDFDDGTGYRIVHFGDIVSINYVNGQSKTVKIKISQNNISYVANAKSASAICSMRLIVKTVLPFLILL